MSPRKKSDQQPVEPLFSVKLSSLATLLDLPAGTEVVEVVAEPEELLLTLAGVDWGQVRGWKPRRGARTPERITADYSVDAHGHRSLTALALPEEPDSARIADDGDPDPTEEKE